MHTVLITGATHGIGRAAATELARLGYRVVIHGRNETLTQSVTQQIISETNNEAVSYILADLSLMSEVRRLAYEVIEKYTTLDILVNNAGAMMGPKRTETSECIEQTIALNTLSPILLTALLKDHLARSPIAKVVFTSSAGHKSLSKPNFKDIELKLHYRPDKAYGNSKLYFLMAMKMMVEHLERQASPVTLHAFHPGIVSTNLVHKILKKVGLYRSWFLKLANMILSTSEEGADTLIYLVTTNQLPERTGGYYIKRRLAKVHPRHFNAFNIQTIWSYCVAKLHLDQW